MMYAQRRVMDSLDQAAVRHIDDAISADSLIIFVGAGISMESGLPSWKDLVDEFKVDIDLSEGENDNLKIAQYYYDAVGQQKYYQTILNIFQQHSNAQPNEIHKEIFRIKPRHIITTNYDSLLEQQMNSGPFKYEVIKKDSDIPYSKSDHYIIKMHGDLSQKNIVLKEDDYLDYENRFYMVANLVKSLIMNNTMLFIGYSLRDSTFNSIFRLIQKGFDGNARKAYFFTSDKQNPAVIEYYKNKGIRVIAGDLHEAGGDRGRCTVGFLSRLNSKRPYDPATPEQVWDNIGFLDKLFFVDTQDVRQSANFGNRVILNPSTSLDWINPSSEPIKVEDNKQLTGFLDSKTLFTHFLDHDRNNTEEYAFRPNPVLLEGFDLYQKQKYSEAKRWFRETANKAFAEKDYWNYLVAEFNVQQIPDWDFRSHPDLPKPITGSITLDQTIEALISNGDEETKKLCKYFRDNVQNFSFLYIKENEINDSLDGLRNERDNYKRGGSSENMLLQKAWVEFHSLVFFVEANCLAVLQYSEFKSVANRYFECLLIAYDNSNYPPQGIFGRTSSIIDKLTLDDVRTFVLYLNEKNIPALMDSYELSKIKITEDAEDYLISHIEELTKQNQRNREHEQELSHYVDFLYFIDIADINKIITSLLQFAPSSMNADSIRKLLIMLLNSADSIHEENYSQIFDIISQHLTAIITNDLIQEHAKNFRIYHRLMERIADQNRKRCFTIQILAEKFCYINDNQKQLTNIAKYGPFIGDFYLFFESSLRTLVDEILVNYEQLADADINVSFIEQMILSHVHEFKTKKELILNTETANILNEDNPAIQFFPDPKKDSVSQLFNLYTDGYFTLDDIKSKIEIKNIRQIYPEIDWVIFHDHSDTIITNLVHNRGFANVRKVFGGSERSKEQEEIDVWLVRQALDGNVKFKKK